MGVKPVRFGHLCILSASTSRCSSPGIMTSSSSCELREGTNQWVLNSPVPSSHCITQLPCVIMSKPPAWLHDMHSMSMSFAASSATTAAVDDCAAAVGAMWSSSIACVGSNWEAAATKRVARCFISAEGCINLIFNKRIICHRAISDRGRRKQQVWPTLRP